MAHRRVKRHAGIWDGRMGPGDIASIRKMFEQKGRDAILNDPSLRIIGQQADEKDVLRKGYLQAMADVCKMGMHAGLSKEDIIELLKGVIDGMEQI